MAGADLFAPTAMIVIVEADGCFLDGVAVVTGVRPGKRNLRIEDMGKTAATFVPADGHTACRISVHPQARERANGYVPEGTPHYEAQLAAYQVMPADELLVFEPVVVHADLLELFQPAPLVHCEQCGEEIIHGRGITTPGRTLCRNCAGLGYYKRAE
jgi:formylmethanofuran dehydrogenase subunit E